MVTKGELTELANIIVENIKEEFSTKHLSGNLINTIQVIDSPEGIKVEIPARTYNMLLFQQKGVIVHTSHGSYASKLNDKGVYFDINGTKIK